MHVFVSVIEASDVLDALIHHQVSFIFTHIHRFMQQATEDTHTPLLRLYLYSPLRAASLAVWSDTQVDFMIQICGAFTDSSLLLWFCSDTLSCKVAMHEHCFRQRIQDQALVSLGCFSSLCCSEEAPLSLSFVFSTHLCILAAEGSLKHWTPHSLRATVPAALTPIRGLQET